MSNRFTISFEDADTTGALDGVSSDPANSTTEVSGAEVDENKETKPEVSGDPALVQENFEAAQDPANSNAEVSGVVTEEPLEAEKDAKAEQDPAVSLDEIELNIETVVAIESELNAIADELCENDRVIEVVEGLQDVQAIVQATPATGGVDIPMLQTAANMAVAGTDADAQAIIPSLESFKNKDVAMEALGEKISSALASVVESVKNIGTRLSQVIKNIFSSIARLEKGIAAREKAIGQIKEPVTFKIKGSRYLQKDKNTHVSNAREYMQSLQEASKFFTAWTALNVKAIADFDGSIGDWYRTILSREDSKEATKRLYDSFVKDFGQNIRGLPGVSVASSSKEVEVYRTPALLGGVVLEASVPRHVVDFETGSRSDIRDGISQTTVMFGKDYLFHNKAAPEIEFTLDTQQLRTIINVDKQLVQSLKQYLNESYKRFKSWADWSGFNSEIGVVLVPTSTLLINRGLNHAAWYTAWSRQYGESLLRSTFVVMDKALAAGAAQAKASPAAAAA